MKKLKKLLLIVLTLVILVSCKQGSGASEQKKDDDNLSKNTSSSNEEGKKEILFWHSMSGANEEKILKIVDGFNSSQDEYYVKAELQGKYDESASKFFAMNNEDGRPAIIQIGEQNLKSMIDSDLISSFDDLIKEYDYPKDELIPGVINFYSLNNKMYAMPFNCSSPIIYYNVEALKNAGVEVPRTYEEIIAIKDKVKEKNDGMKVLGLHAYGYALEQMATNLGGFVVNNENGRSSDATEVAYQKEMTDIFNVVSSLVKTGDFVNFGANSDNAVSGFYNKDMAMFVHTSALARSIIDQAPFEVGMANLPTFEGKEAEGVYAAGGAIVAPNNLSEDEEKGVMEFLKYATSSEVQAEWSGDTGYFPINQKSYETDTIKKVYDDYPQFKIASDQFLASKQTPATAGPLLAQLPQLRGDLEAAIESVFNGGDPKEAVDKAADATNRKIQAGQ